MASGITSPSARMASMTLSIWTVFHSTMAAVTRVGHAGQAKLGGVGQNGGHDGSCRRR